MVPVVLFHSGIPFFQGGYLGVDIFFVISGYLITTIILDDIEQKRFSILSFYERRFRRILPAYVLVIIVSMVVGWFWMMPDQLRNFAQSVFASSIFSSNILFLTEAGYFVPGSAEKPLLHTWSLSVEEQFYVFFPMLLLALSTLRWRWSVITIAFLIVVSIAFSEYGWRYIPSANFYLLPFRAWELGFGVLSAIFLRRYGPQTNSLCAGAGLITVAGSIALFDESTPVPSLYALLPVFGTVLIIVFASSNTWVSKLLSLRAVVFTGLISYSTYLWHQPLLAFARIRSIPSASEELLALAAVSSFVIGYFSWRYVEQPFRKSSTLFSLSRARLLGGSFAVLTVLGAVGLFGHFANGFPNRLPENVLTLASFVNDKSPLENDSNCAFYHGRPLPAHPAERCDDYLVDGRADVLFIGDSHSGAMSYDAQIALKSNGISSYAVSYSGCIGLRGFRHLGMPVNYDCNGYNDSMIAYARKVGAKVLVITSRFPLYLYGKRFDNKEGGLEIGGEVHYERIEDSNSIENLSAGREQNMLKGFKYEINRLTEEFSVVLLDPIPEAGWYVPQLASKISLFQGVNQFTVSTDYSEYKKRTTEIIQVFDEIDSPRLFRVHPQNALCNRIIPGRCVNATNLEAYYFDNNHISRTGARIFLPDIINAIKTAINNENMSNVK